MKIKYEREIIFGFFYVLKNIHKNDNFSGEGSSNHKNNKRKRQIRFKPSPAAAPFDVIVLQYLGEEITREIRNNCFSEEMLVKVFPRVVSQRRSEWNRG